MSDDTPLFFHPPLAPRKGRGAVSNLAHRFSQDAREWFDDGWVAPDTPVSIAARADWESAEAVFDAESEASAEDHAPPSLATEIRLEDCKSALCSNDSPDLPFERSLNPYRGCEHGCIYCFARPTHSYLGLSPGLDFETRIIAKPNIAAVLRRELAAPSYRPSGLVIGAATDCYQPIERQLRLTRAAIEVLAEARHPFSVITKSSAVEHDLDLIVPLAARGLAAVYVTITTLDAALARQLEPRAATPARRLRTLRTLAAAGVPTGVSVAPQIPFINNDMEQVLQAARDAGAERAFYTVLRLPWEVAPLFQEWLAAHFPDRAARVMARVRDMRGGRDYQAQFGRRMQGEGVWADLLAQRFAAACTRLGLNGERRGVLDCSQFRPPALNGQQSLF